MPRIAQLLLALSIGLFLSFLTPQSARAFCFSTADCPAGLICRGGFLGIPVCRQIACNFNVDCPANQRPCAGGVCRFPPTTAGGGSSGGGTAPAGVGQACGRVQMGGGVIKNVGCRRNLQCINGRCQQRQI